MKPGKRAKTLFFFSNGNTAVFDGNEQIPELQVSWFRLAIEWMRKQGVDVEHCEIMLPAGDAEIIPLPEHEAGMPDWNWRIKS